MIITCFVVHLFIRLTGQYILIFLYCLFRPAASPTDGMSHQCDPVENYTDCNLTHTIVSFMCLALASAGFWIFTFAGCCHFWEMFWCFLPGLVLYGVDGVYRIHQGLGFWGSSGSGGSSGSNGGVEVLEAVASQGKTTCSLLLAAPRWGLGRFSGRGVSGSLDPLGCAAGRGAGCCVYSNNDNKD